MHEIDLGEEITFKVKYKGVEYSLVEPTVAQIEKLRKSEDRDGFLVDFLNELGLPKDVVSGMGMSKATTLLESITNLVSKKK